MASLLPNARNYFADQNGRPLAGGKVYFYRVGTEIKKDTYQDPDQSIPNTNPIILDSRGEAIIWGTGAYRQVLTDKDDVEIWDQIVEDADASLSGDMVNAVYIAGATETPATSDTPGTFIPGITTTLTLPVAPGARSNMLVFFDSLFQTDDQVESLAQTTLTFADPIPVGVGEVTVRIGRTIAISIPASGTINDDSVAEDAAIDSKKLSYRLDAVNAVRRSIYDEMSEIISVADFGAKGDGVTDDTTAIQNAINFVSSYGSFESHVCLYFPKGQYSVTSIVFPRDPSAPTYDVFFDGAQIVGAAKTTTDAIVTLQMEGSTFYGLDVNMNFNTNYVCGVRWYNASASSQYNTFFGFKIKYGVRGMIYGVNSGSTDTGFAQSENSIYGWRTRGVQNPLLMNHSQGFLNFSAPQFVSGNEEWAAHPSVTFDWAVARAFEIVNGWLYQSGGEIQKSGSPLGFAADLSNCQIENANIEIASPMQLVGPPSGAPTPSSGVNLSNCRMLMTSAAKPMWTAAAALQPGASLSMANCQFLRPLGTGAFDRTPMVDVSIAVTNPPAVTIEGGSIQEWAFVTVGGSCPIIKGTADYIYRGVRLRQTNADANVFLLDNTLNNLLENRGIDTLAYSQTGWYNNTDSGTTSVSVNANGPAGYNPSSLGILATGVARIISANEPGGTATLKATAFVVRPGEHYSIEAQLNNLGGTAFRTTARFYTAAGSLLSEVPVADQTNLSGTNWGKVMGVFTVPAGAYYMAVGVLANNANGQFTDLRLRRA